jgi:hypothetical protein
MLTADSPAEQKEASVRERAQARWQALIVGDVAKAYEYLSPATRDTMSLDQYRGRIRVGMHRVAKVESVKCEAEVCKVTMSITFDHRLMKGIVTPLDETWILEKGRFWFLYRA